jgi:hypothetical protein
MASPPLCWPRIAAGLARWSSSKKHMGSINLTGVDALIATCALDDKHSMQLALAADPQLKPELISQGGTLLAQFSGVGNRQGVRNVLDLGVNAGAIYHEGDVY